MSSTLQFVEENVNDNDKVEDCEEQDDNHILFAGTSQYVVGHNSSPEMGFDAAYTYSNGSQDESLDGMERPKHPGGVDEDNTFDMDESRQVRGEYSDIEQKRIAWNFAMEQQIFSKALLELLAERDKAATVVGMNDPIVIKSGPLKKASHLMSGIWKVKFVEIRRGMFSYYDDTISHEGKVGGEMLRKNIPLEANYCGCRAVRLHQKALNITPRGSIFEITVHGRPKKLWMVNSREERQAWIQAINDAMVGGSVTRGGTQVDANGRSLGSSALSVHKMDFHKYIKVQNTLKKAREKDDYVGGISSLLGLSLKIPVKWIIKRVEESKGDTKGAFHEGDVKVGVDQLFKDLHRDVVQINGKIFQGDSGHGPERILSDLSCNILNLGRVSSSFDINEAQAVSYARDILLAGNRTRSAGDSYFCVDTLCSNPHLVVLVPGASAAEPICITVQRDEEISPDYITKSGWLLTRHRKRNSWKKLYFVLANEGTLSYYKQAHPRPVGFQGQLTLADATITVKKDVKERGPGNEKNIFVLHISTKKDMKMRQIRFDTEEKLLDWTYALECTAKGNTGATSGLLQRVRNSLRKGKSEGLEDDPFAAEASLKEHVAHLGLDDDKLKQRLAAYGSKKLCTVKISVSAMTEYKICTIDPQGDEREDKWATVQATFNQEFRVSGGPHGRMIRSEEIVQVKAMDCQNTFELEGMNGYSLETPSPASPTKGRLPIPNIFRSSTADAGTESHGIFRQDLLNRIGGG